jgi:hypothetical protein
LKAYSDRNLIGQELNKDTFFKRIFVAANVHLKLLVPSDIFFRSQVLCEDVCDLTEERFKLDHLVEMLWSDFLNNVRKKQDIKNTYKLLLEYDQGTPNVRLKRYDVKGIEEVPLYPVRKKNDDQIERFYCKMKRKLALRGEVMLSDISKVYPQHPFTLERVLEILLIDFMIKYERGEAVNILMENLE